MSTPKIEKNNVKNRFLPIPETVAKGLEPEPKITDLPEEKKRIYKMGGVVDQMVDMNGMKAGPPRVWGRGKTFPGLAMSRSLGDFKGKEYGIISLPEIIEYTLDENSKYMVISSDGVWEFLSNENVMEIGNKFYEKITTEKEGLEAQLKEKEIVINKNNKLISELNGRINNLLRQNKDKEESIKKISLEKENENNIIFSQNKK